MAGIHGRMAELYDLFVDWDGRLSREMPGLTSRLRAAGAARVLDVGCGTGRHVAALTEAGFDAHGADLSPDMLDQARALLADGARLYAWRVGDAPPPALAQAGPFDAIVCLGNVWPHLLDAVDVEAGLAAFRALLRPGGLALVGLKAVAVRREAGNPYLPLLRRERDGRPYYFVRFCDFGLPRRPDGTDACELHLVVVAGGTRGAEPEPLVHRAHAIRVWDAAGLEAAFCDAGFSDVAVSARLDDPAVVPEWEDVFVHAVSAP